MEAGFQQLGQSGASPGGSTLIMNIPRTKLPVPGSKTHNGGVLRSDVRPAADILRGSVLGRVCAGNFARVCMSLSGGSMC